jgi:fimbrial chaperone protein
MKFLVFLFALFTLSSASAFKLSPMTQQLVLDGQNRKSLFTIINDGDKPIAVQSEVTKRIMDEYGKEENPSADDEFLVFPDQLIIKPGEKRAIQVTFLGKEVPQVEKAYRFIAEQLPIEIIEKKKKKSNIKILLKYRAAFYLSPSEGKPSLSLKNKKATVNKGKIEITLKNNGTTHEILKDYVLKVKGEKREKSLPFSTLTELFGENILAKHERTFRISLPKEFKEQQSLSLELNGKLVGSR